MSNTIQIYGIPYSACTRRVLTTLEECGIAYELHPIDIIKGEQKNPEFMAKHQPFGQIPVMWDGDYRLFESRAIMKYIAQKAGNKDLYPEDAKQRGLVEQWMSVENNKYSPAEELVSEALKAFRGLTPDADHVADAEKRFHAVLEIFNTHLAKNKYIAGDHFTLADISFLPYTSYALAQPQYANLLDKYPHVKTWWSLITSRPSWQKISKSQ